MISCARLVVIGALLFNGCQTARDVAVTSFRVIDAPANYIRHRIDEPETTTTTTTTQTERYQPSDVSNPGEPVTEPTPRPTPSARRRVAVEESRTARPQPSPTVRRTPPPTAAQRKPSPSPTPRNALAKQQQAPQFPTARPVPGQPGHVYSIDPKGGIVDVTGYKKGDKAKDPYTQQIFIVP